ncbi:MULTISPECIES: hypothetical protein [Amycolatopsis]|uniref:Uncharacterized protein n=1 Tax=Amycolatopsis albidoflavus TaxID=102226 RepID=A0ABW5HXC1_9PSEU
MGSAQLLVQVQCVVVAGDGPPVLAEVVVGDSEAVPGVGLAVPAADRPMQFEGLAAGAQRVGVLAQNNRSALDKHR